MPETLKGAEALMSVEPQPMFIDKGRIAVSWSMKSACSHVALWTFSCEALLHAARYYHPWPHEFRLNVYYRARGYQNARRSFLAGAQGERVLLKITRDPAKRLVSIFRHVCRYDFLWPLIAKRTGAKVERDGLSLEDFGRFLDTCKLELPTDVNPHLCLQKHPCWDLAVDRVITVNIDTHDLDEALRAVEAEYSLRASTPQLAKTVEALAERHYAPKTALIYPDPIENYRFRASETGDFPKSALERSPLLQDLARRHYAKDFECTATSDTAARLFAC